MKRRAAVVLGCVAVIIGATAVPTAASGSMVVTIVKQVKGTAPGGTTFTVHYDCGAGGSGDRTFDATGAPIGSNTFDMYLAVTCTVTETTGGADNVAFVCSNATGAATCDDGNQVTHTVQAGVAAATITVTNAYANALGPMTVNPTNATPGQLVTVSGSGCTKDLFGGSVDDGGEVNVTINFATPIHLSTVAAGTTGAWSVEFTVPTDARGPYAVSGECGDPVPYASATLTTPGAATAVEAVPTTTG